MTNDMTRGNPTRLIISFTLPVLFGNLCQQLYGMVDSIIVGRAISMEALAAVGATSGISFLVIGCIQGLTAGFSVITAQRFGAGDYEGVKPVSYTHLRIIVSFTLDAAWLRPIYDSFREKKSNGLTAVREISGNKAGEGRLRVCSDGGLLPVFQGFTETACKPKAYSFLIVEGRGLLNNLEPTGEARR